MPANLGFFNSSLSLRCHSKIDANHMDGESNVVTS
jgi:hypothetical protein